MKNYNPLPVVIDRGEGAYLFDTNGKSYIDFVSGVAVCSLGYGNIGLSNAIAEQARKILHTSNLVWNENAVLLEKALCEASFAERVFLCNSGVEANEAMLKLARKYFADKGSERFEIICMDKAFHGRSLAAISCTGQTKYQKGFGPLLPGFKVVPFGDIAALRQAVDSKTAAIILEPIAGEGGMLVPPGDYLKDVRQLCDQEGILMLLDEVQSGIGRTGKLFAYEHVGVEPDVMTLAKGLGGGMPIGALLTKNTIAQVLTAGSHGSTFGGNPVCSAAARYVLSVVNTPDFLDKVASLGEFLISYLNNLQSKYPKHILNVRGKGLWIGMELHQDASRMKDLALEQGLILNLCGTNVVRFAPPLVITKETLLEGLKRFEDVFKIWAEM